MAMAMMMMAGTLAAAWLVMACASETSIARWLNHWLVEWPAAKLIDVERRHLIFIVVALVSAQALLSVGLPDVGLVVAWDVSTYVDIVLATWTLAAVTNLKAANRLAVQRWRLLASGLRRGRPQPRSKRPARRPTQTPSANDDDHPALAIAA